MALTTRLELRQGQALVMTPQLQQAIKLLQLNNLDLAAYVEQELERNPLLERGEADGPGPEERDGAEAASPGDAAQDGAALSLSDDMPPAHGDANLETGYDNVYADESAADRQNDRAERDSAAAPAPDSHGPGSGDYAGAKTRSGSFDDEDSSLEGRVSESPNLKDHLTEQMTVALTDPVERVVAAFLIDCTDEAGYCRVDMVETAEQLGAPLDMVERILTLCQSFDPAGVMARDLPECLALQLRDRGRFDPMIEKLLANLDVLARHDLQALCRACDCDVDDAADMISEIRTLNPKPGLAFGAEPVQPVVPDVYVYEKPGQGWHVELNAETLPRVLVNERYYAEVKGVGAACEETKTYLSDRLQEANWLVKSLDQRARTILKVAGEIVRQQDAFLVHGVQHLRPLNLKAIADAISMHESTVSRVTANKYIATPRGVFELKYFFTSAIASSEGGEAHSAEAVRHRIRVLIEDETPENVLSDDRLVEILRGQGIDIARRTVAKYREAMRIPSSVQRRRLKKRSA